MSRLRNNPKGITLLKGDEGCKLTAYPDINNIPTIGYGDIYITRNGKLRRVVMGDTCTQAEADEMFWAAEEEREQQVDRLLKAAVNDNQYAAILNWEYQFGCGNMAASTLLKKINANPNENMTPEFVKFLYTMKGYISRAATVTEEGESAFIADWQKEMINCPADSIAFQFLRWIHGNHGQVVFGLLVRQMKNVILYNTPA